MKALDKINIRRALLFIQKEVSKIFRDYLQNSESEIWLKYSIDNKLFEAQKVMTFDYDFIIVGNDCLFEFNFGGDGIYLELSHNKFYSTEF